MMWNSFNLFYSELKLIFDKVAAQVKIFSFLARYKKCRFHRTKDQSIPPHLNWYLKYYYIKFVLKLKQKFSPFLISTMMIKKLPNTQQSEIFIIFLIFKDAPRLNILCNLVITLLMFSISYQKERWNFSNCLKTCHVLF